MRGVKSVLVAAALAGLILTLPDLADADESAPVSLEALMEAGRETHPSLARKPLLRDSLKLQQSKMNKAYWPQLLVAGQATWQSDVTSVDIPIPGATISPPPKDQYRLALELKQNLWDGGVIADQKRVAEKRTRIAQEKVDLAWYQVRGRILQLYFAGVVQQELEGQAITLEHHLAKLVATVELSLENGVATKRDVLLVQARQLEAQQAMADARGQLESVRQSLRDLTGKDLPVGSTLAAPPARCAESNTRPEPDSIHRPELRLLAAQQQLLDAQDDLEKAGDRPKVGAFATAGYGRPGLNALSDQFDSYVIGGVQLTVPLSYLYTGSRRNSRDQLAVQRSLLARQQDEVMTQVRVQLDSQHAEVSRLDQTLALDAQLLLVREGARKQTELQVSLGTAGMSDLIDDLTREDQARTREAVHRAQRALACHQLEFTVGNL